MDLYSTFRSEDTEAIEAAEFKQMGFCFHVVFESENAFAQSNVKR